MTNHEYVSMFDSWFDKASDSIERRRKDVEKEVYQEVWYSGYSVATLKAETFIAKILLETYDDDRKKFLKEVFAILTESAVGGMFFNLRLEGATEKAKSLLEDDQ